MKIQRFSYIDSSRGIAAFCVILHHFVCYYFQQPYNSQLTQISSFIWNGSSAVAYFFVLSGFILSVGYFKSEDNIINLDYKQYAVQRFFRIYPLFLACLIISYILNASLHWNKHIPTFPPSTTYASNIWNYSRSLPDLLKEGFLIRRIPVHATDRLLPQDWTLSLELIMSLFIPLLVFVLNRGFFWFVVFFALLFNYDMYVLPFAAGILLAKHREVFIERYRQLSYSGKVLFMLASLFFYSNGCSLIGNLTNDRFAFTLLMQVVGAVFLLGILISSAMVQRLMSNKVLVFFGKISFGVYLTHFFVLIFFVPHCIHYLNLLGLFSTPNVLLISFCLLVMVSVLVSTVLHYLVELPFIKIGKNILNYKIWNKGNYRMVIHFFRLKVISLKEGDDHL